MQLTFFRLFYLLFLREFTFFTYLLSTLIVKRFLELWKLLFLLLFLIWLFFRTYGVIWLFYTIVDKIINITFYLLLLSLCVRIVLFSSLTFILIFSLSLFLVNFLLFTLSSSSSSSDNPIHFFNPPALIKMRRSTPNIIPPWPLINQSHSKQIMIIKLIHSICIMHKINKSLIPTMLYNLFNSTI